MSPEISSLERHQSQGAFQFASVALSRLCRCTSSCREFAVNSEIIQNFPTAKFLCENPAKFFEVIRRLLVELKDSHS